MSGVSAGASRGPPTPPPPRLRAETLLWATRFLTAYYGVPLVLFDVDVTQVVAYVSTAAEVRVQRIALGSGRVPSFATWVRSRLPNLAPDAITDLVDRHLRGVPPADAAMLDAQLVLTAGRRGLLPHVPGDAWLVVTGRLAAHLADPLRLGLWLLEAARPRGRGLLLWDDADALSLLAALAPAMPRCAVALAADGCLPLGGYLADHAATQRSLVVELANGTTRELTVGPGEIARVLLPPAQRPLVRLAGDDLLSVVGGPLGLLVDARPREREATLDAFTAWVTALRAVEPAARVRVQVAPEGTP